MQYAVEVSISESEIVNQIVYFSGGLSSKPSDEKMPTVRSPVSVSRAIDWSYGGWVGTWSAKTGIGTIKNKTSPRRTKVLNLYKRFIF